MSYRSLVRPENGDSFSHGLTCFNTFGEGSPYWYGGASYTML